MPTLNELPNAQKATAATDPTAPNVDPPYDGLSVTGFVLSLGSVVLFFSAHQLAILPFLAIIFSAVGVTRTKDGKRKGRALAGWGLFLGIVTAIGVYLCWAYPKYEWPFELGSPFRETWRHLWGR